MSSTIRDDGAPSAPTVLTTIALGSCRPASSASLSQRSNIVIGSGARSASSRPARPYSSRRARETRQVHASTLVGAAGTMPRRLTPVTRGMTEVHHGLEGVVAFETQIAEPDKEGSALRYRGVDIEDIVGRVPFENVWGLLIDGSYTPGLSPAEPYNLPVHTGDVRVDVQAAVAMLAPAFGFGQTYDISDEQAREDLGRLAVMVLSYAAQSARGLHQPVVPQRVGRRGQDPRGEVPDPLEGRGGPQARHRRSTPTGARRPSTA